MVPRASDRGVTLGFRWLRDEYPKEEKPKRGREGVSDLSRLNERLNGVQLESEIRVDHPPLQYLGKIEDRSNKGRNNG